jgi:hypothetical protein
VRAPRAPLPRRHSDFRVAAFGRKPPFEFPHSLRRSAETPLRQNGCPVPKRQRAGALQDASRSPGRSEIPPGFGLRQPSAAFSTPAYCVHSNANCPNRPTQNEYRKRVPVRRHPLSCDFNATRQISVIAQPRAPRPAPRCPGGIRNAVLECADTSALSKRRHVAAVQVVASSLWLDPIRPQAERYTSRLRLRPVRLLFASGQRRRGPQRYSS